MQDVSAAEAVAPFCYHVKEWIGAFAAALDGLEGGELGYSLSHSFGAVFDNPELIAAWVVGDGEAEIGSLAAAWHSNKFLNPATDRVVLPIPHPNGYKISNPAILARIEHDELDHLPEAATQGQTR